MSDDFLATAHKKFKYVLIPADIDDEVQELEYEGKEGDFQNLMRQHFTNDCKMTSEQEQQLAASLAQDAGLKDVIKNENSKEYLDTLTNMAGTTYQVIPLTVPSKDNHFEAVNAYIDNVGRVKDLPTNARASRITSDDIKGDAFVSKTFDDEMDFRRLDFGMNDYKSMLQNPPSKAGRWDPTTAMANLKGDGESILRKMKNEKGTEKMNNECGNCRKNKVPLALCGRCRKVGYCCRDCQIADWKFHRRICS